MRRARCFVAAALVAGLLGPATTAQAEPARPVAPAKTQTITLISGDKVVVDEKGALVRVDGRPGMSFAKYVQNDHQYVVPADAVDAVGQDRVDKRFFDVTALHEFAYTDDRIDQIPVLDHGLRAASAVPKKEAARRWQQRATARNAGKLWLNGKSKVLLDQSVPMVGAPGAWQAGFDGTGVTVAVLDTGYDQQHPELKDVVSVAKDFTPAGIQDNIGHGTHVAATIAGHGDRYTGVAKGAKLAVGRVCEANWCLESAILAGMDWAAREVRAKVVNMSLGSDQTDGTDPLSLKVNQLTEETGTLFVVAAGNAGTRRRVSAPASADAALAVANLTKSGVVNEWSQRGPRLTDFAVKPDIAAPGTDIVAARAAWTLPDNAVDELHARLTGTSMAAPHVAGAAAILAQRNPSWTPAELKAHLMATVKPVAAPSSDVGTGLVDVQRAVGQQVRADVGSLSFGMLEWPHSKTLTKTVTYRNDGDQPVSLSLRHTLGADFAVPSTVVVPAHGTAPVEVVLDPRKGTGMFYGQLTASAPGVTVTTAVGAYVQEERHTLSVEMTGRDGKPVPDEFLVLINMATNEASLLSVKDGVGSMRVAAAEYAVIGTIEEKTANYAWFTPVSVTELSGRVSLTADTSVKLDARQAKQFSVDLPDKESELWYRMAELRVPLQFDKVNALSSTTDGRVPLYGMSFGQPLPQLAHETALQGGLPLISVVGGFPVVYFEDSGYLPPGDHRFDVAERGTDVRGKLALVRPADEDPHAVASAMMEAGAVAVLWAGRVPFGAFERTAIPVIAVAEHHVTTPPAQLTLRAVAGSPVAYKLYLRDKGAPPTGTRHVRRSELAEVKARYHSSGQDGVVGQRLYPVVDGKTRLEIGALDEDFAGPAQRTEYYSTGNGIGWYQEGFDGPYASWSDLAPVTYQPGHKYERSNMKAVAAPRFGRASEVTWALGGGVDRVGDKITMRLSPFGGSTWVESWRYAGWGYSELLHNGKTLEYSDLRQGEFTAPDRTGKYTLKVNPVRDTSELSTEIRTSWDFTAAADGKLPLLQVDYALPLDLRNSWTAGVPMPAKFTASRQPGAPSATVRELHAYASFDDGVNWVPVKSLVPPGGKAGGYVSLRVVAVDADGGSVDQTVLRAYRLKA